MRRLSIVAVYRSEYKIDSELHLKMVPTWINAWKEIKLTIRLRTDLAKLNSYWIHIPICDSVKDSDSKRNCVANWTSPRYLSGLGQSAHVKEEQFGLEFGYMCSTISIMAQIIFTCQRKSCSRNRISIVAHSKR